MKDVKKEITPINSDLTAIERGDFSTGVSKAGIRNAQNLIGGACGKLGGSKVRVLGFARDFIRRSLPEADLGENSRH